MATLEKISDSTSAMTKRKIRTESSEPLEKSSDSTKPNVTPTRKSKKEPLDTEKVPKKRSKIMPVKRGKAPINKRIIEISAPIRKGNYSVLFCLLGGVVASSLCRLYVSRCVALQLSCLTSNCFYYSNVNTVYSVPNLNF